MTTKITLSFETELDDLESIVELYVKMKELKVFEFKSMHKEGSIVVDNPHMIIEHPGIIGFDV